MNDDFDVLDYEMQLWQQSQGYQLTKPKIEIDHNWQALKQERNTPVIPQPAIIEKISNVSLVLWGNKNYTDGNLTCDVYREGVKQEYKKNLIFEVIPELTPRQFRIWDLIATDSHLAGCKARRCKFYEKDHAEDYSAEFAHFEIWRDHKLLMAYLLVEDCIIPMNITIDEYHNTGNIRMNAPWSKRQTLDVWYANNL